MIVAAFGLSGTAAAQSYDIVIAHNPPSYVIAAAEAFKQYVETATGGDITVRPVSYGALGSGREVADQLRLGEIEFFIAGVPDIAGVFPDGQVHNWPVMFTSRAEFWGLTEDADYVAFLRDRLLADSSDQVRLFGLMENSIRHLYTTKRPIRVPEGLAREGVKMRTMAAPLHQRVWEALGSPQIVAISAPERYQALQSGLIDGTEGGLASAWGAGLMEVSDYISLTGHMYDYHWLIGNESFFQSLPEEYQVIVHEAALVARQTQNAAVVRDNAEALALMVEAGKIVTVPTEAELAEWQAIVEPVAAEFIRAEVSAEVIDATFEALARVREGFATVRGD